MLMASSQQSIAHDPSPLCCSNWEVQPFSCNFRTSNVAKEFHIGLYDHTRSPEIPALSLLPKSFTSASTIYVVVQAELEHFWDRCSAGVLREGL